MKCATIVTLCLLVAIVLGKDFSAKPGHGVFKGFNIVDPPRIVEVDVIDARDFTHNEIIPQIGVSRECLIMLDNIAWLVQTNGFKSLCPRQQFGALLVNFADKTGSVKDSMGRSCGRIVQTNHAPKTLTDTTEHSEMDAMRRLAYTKGLGQRNNVSFWEPLAVITPGASCPMDASAIRWSNIRWHVASLSIDDLITLNFSQIAIEPDYIFRHSGSDLTSPPAGTINYVNREVNVGRFGYRFIPSNPCPVGCHRPSPGADCTDDVPYVITTNIPDVDYPQAPGGFALVADPTAP